MKSWENSTDWDTAASIFHWLEQFELWGLVNLIVQIEKRFYFCLIIKSPYV